MRKLLQNQRGIGHIGVIVAIVVVLAVGGVGWWVWQKNKGDEGASKSLQEAVKNAKCDYEDKDICKFFASWKETNSYTVESTSEVQGKTVNMTILTDSDKTHVKLSGDAPYETITIGDTLYTKAGNTWYKQTLDASALEAYQGVDTDFVEPTEAETNITYTKLGTEKCGDHTCLKYEMVDASNADTRHYLWFDDKHYQLRKMEVVSKDNTKYTATFTYTKVNINEPSPVQELGPNQYIVPGQNEPVTLPASGDMPSEEELQNLINQYQ